MYRKEEREREREKTAKIFIRADRINYDMMTKMKAILNNKLKEMYKCVQQEITKEKRKEEIYKVSMVISS
jgi:hypothetical protein